MKNFDCRFQRLYENLVSETSANVSCIGNNTWLLGCIGENPSQKGRYRGKLTLICIAP